MSSVVESHSAELKKELGLRDLVLQQIVYVVGVIWVGTAAKLGHQHFAFWIAAIVFFYLPQAAVVIDLTKRMPLEGGLYQWARLGISELMGFMVAWNLWIYAVVLIATIGLVVGTNLSYVVGRGGEWLASNKIFLMALNIFLIGGLMAMAVRGLALSKWLHNLGSISLMSAFAVMIALPFVHMARGTLPDYHPFAVAMPAFTLLSLNIFGKMAMGALSGFEYVAIMAGETRSASRTITRSVLVAAPLIVLMFILGTDSVIALVPKDRIDLVSPIPQALSVGFEGSGVVRMIVPALILLLLLRQLGVVTMVFNGNTRLPLVAGWDNLLPAWFTRLHPSFRTPVNSILFVSAITIAFSLAGQAGVGVQEAFQLLENAAGILYAFTYLGLFAIPLFGAAKLQRRPPLWLRIASASGFGMALLYSILSVFPIIEVASWRIFALKIITVILAANLMGVAIYWGGRRSSASSG